ncbi:MAG: collagen binding domain-containing protein, partial [Clostridia bacterium]
ENCQNPLYIKNEETGKLEVAELVTSETGIIKLENVPLGEYYIKEVEAPKGYELSKEVTKVTLDTINKNTMVYQALIEDSLLTRFITKTDIFTGEVIPNCTFEIADEDGKVLLHSVTNEKGEAHIPVTLFEDGKTYTYTEIEAPDIYDLNTEPHEFVAEFDEEGNWITEPVKVDNRRKTREVIVRKLDAETGEPLEGCVFTIALIDEKTGEQIKNAQTGEPVYLVENATTNENGEFVIEKAPMGTYKFTEIKAPEGYELDEDLTGLVFTINNDSPETIIFEVTNTGDIAVVAIVCISLVCIAGIVFVIMKNRKQRV